jgi:hypothetical protein
VRLKTIMMMDYTNLSDSLGELYDEKIHLEYQEIIQRK